MHARPSSQTRAPVWIVEGGQLRQRLDQLATEEPLEIRLRTVDSLQTVAVTMRTPGADFELAAGFLFSEGVLRGRQDIQAIRYCVDRVEVVLTPDWVPDLRPLERHFFTNSACGVCGKAGLEALEQRGCVPLAPGPQLDPAMLRTLPERLRAAQRLFATTGGLHAAALFDAEGALIAVREDVGRHNALDKLIGWALLEDRLPLADRVLLVSGRASYEILQKAIVAGVPVVAAVSAPSSLAVELAAAFGVTLIGFLRGDRFNVYTGLERLRLALPG
jgi:FdhD protein